MNRKNALLAAAAAVISLAAFFGVRMIYSGNNISDETSGETSTETSGEISVPAAEYIKITPEQARGMMDADAVILDVRTAEEYKGYHIENAVLLPDYEIRSRAADVLPDKDQVILIYCRTGRRSESAARILIGMGYTRVYDFGGIIDTGIQ